MKLRRIFLFTLAGGFFPVAGLFAAGIKSTNETVATPPVYVPSTSHANEPMPDGVFAWNNFLQNTDAAADQAEAHFTFIFTNVSPDSVSILDVHPSCGCTTTELPALPWTIPPGAVEKIPVTVNIAGKTGILLKKITVSTDKGSKDLYVRIAMLAPVIPTMNGADRARGVAAAKIDRQAVFQNDCATCHAKPGEGKYGEALYDSVCAVCHEAENRATMVPDLHALKIYTNDEFWRTWIAHGKAGSFMPAFSTAEGGPLSDMQIASLAQYLDQAIPSLVPQPAVQ